MKKPLNLEDILLDKPVEDELIEVPLAEKVFKLFFAVSAVVFLVIVFQLVNIGLDQDLYKKSALANIMRAQIQKAPRGIIKDRFGNPLLENGPAFRAFLSLKDFSHNPKERDEELGKISEVFGITKEELVEKIENHDWRLGRLLLDDSLSQEKLVALSSRNLTGVDIEPSFVRIPADSFAFSHILGYVGLVTKDDLVSNPELYSEDEIGKTGLEYYYDKVLRGKNGKKIRVFNAAGEVYEERVVSKPQPGRDLNTFIDKEFQIYFYKRLKEQIDFLGSSGGAGIAVNPQNGEVLALFSIPSFDLQKVADYLERKNTPLFNRAVGGLYNPGSTIKPLVAIAALEEGIITPTTQFFSGGYIKLDNPYDPDNPSIYRDWKPHGWVNLYSSLARSSNVYYYIVGGGYKEFKGLGIERLNKWWKLFRLNRKTGIDTMGEGQGFLPNPSWKKKNSGSDWRIGDTYNVSIGQGDLLLTPLELISYISAIANGGKLYKLRISSKIPEVLADLGDIIKESSFEAVRQGMRDAVKMSYGTAYELSDLPFSVSAKTGSAEAGTKNTNAFFVGYAPSENPQIAILVLIEGAKEGSMNTTPVARDVFLWYYEHRMAK